jgi:hypothetical protein
MKNSLVFCIVVGFMLSVALVAQAQAADTPLLLAAAKKAKAGASAPAGDVQAQLDAFAQRTIASINRCVIPSKAKKEVTNSGGKYTARYVEIDPASVRTSYKSSTSSVVSYIGYMNYEEVEYVCTGSSAKAANSGPCVPLRREKMTELVKYVNGDWTY